MTLTQVKQAMKLYPMADKQAAIRQAIAYCKALETLGSKHILATKVQRLDTPRYI